MPPWARTTWVDDDGSLTVGTPFSAAKMNNLEDGVEERPPALAHDAASASAAGGGTLNWEHTPVCKRPAAILVLISQNWVTSTADQVISVSYGEQLMRRIGELRTAGRGVQYAYLLTGKIKRGKQSVSVAVSGSASKAAVAVSLSGPQLQRVKAKVFTNVQASTTAPVLEDATAWDERVVYGVLSSNKNPAPGAGQTELKEVEFASEVFTQWDVNNSNTEPGKAPFAQWGTQTSGTSGMLLVQLGLVKDWGEVTELPTGCCPGDICHFVADATNNIVWDLEYDNRNTTYPWRKVGGAAIRVSNTSTTETAGEVQVLSTTVPCAMEFRALYGVRQSSLKGTGATQGTALLYVNGSPKDTSAEVAFSEFGGSPLVGASETYTVASGQAIALKVSSNNGRTTAFGAPYIEVNPLRVG